MQDKAPVWWRRHRTQKHIDMICVALCVARSRFESHRINDSELGRNWRCKRKRWDQVLVPRIMSAGMGTALSLWRARTPSFWAVLRKTLL